MENTDLFIDDFDTEGAVLYHMPCCWERESEKSFFLGKAFYPLIWATDRYFWKMNDNGLLSLEGVYDDCYVRKDIKKEILDKMVDSKPYKLPHAMESAVDHIKNIYCSANNWVDSLYVENYGSDWSNILDDVYTKEINIINRIWPDILRQFEKQAVEHNFSGGASEAPRWCFIPSDCASCS